MSAHSHIKTEIKSALIQVLQELDWLENVSQDKQVPQLSGNIYCQKRRLHFIKYVPTRGARD